MKTIKSLLDDKDKVSLSCGAANAMIAKLAENAGFDGKLYIDNNTPIFGWDSEFSISDIAPYMEKVQIQYI